MEPPDPLKGSQPLRRPTLLTPDLPPERVPFPCHRRMPAMLIVDYELSLQFWEYPCRAIGCDFLYRFTKQWRMIRWEPIDGYTVPDSDRPWSEPVDTVAVIQRLIRERLPAA